MSKLDCAKKAYDLIEDGMVIGLGGGTTVSLIIDLLSQHPKNIRAVTPSQSTMKSCVEHGVPLLPVEMTGHVDLAFDGCDEIDSRLNALKSNGGIHTREKIVASLADDYILLADSQKLSKGLTFDHPVVVEVIPSALSYVKMRLRELGARVEERTFSGKAGTAVSDDGNYLIDAWFSKTDDPEALNQSIQAITGVVETSLFTGIVSHAILADEDETTIVEPYADYEQVV